MEVETANSSVPSTSTASNDTSMNTATVAEIEDFLQTGRTGRRNAVPDIKDENIANTSTADLPLELQKLTCSETKEAVNAGASGSNSDTFRQ